MSTLLEEVYAMPGGESVRLCIQCGTCSGCCPNADKMDYSPRQVIGMVRAGFGEEVLSSNSMWFCVSCYFCTVRCPRGLPATDIMYMLRSLALRHHLTRKGARTSPLVKAFVETVNKYGRNHELELLTRYYLRTNPLNALKALPVGLKMFARGLLPLRAEKIRERDKLRAIVEKAEALQGTA